MFETHIPYNMAQNHVFLNIHNISLIIEFIWFWLCKIEYGLRYGINSHIITNHHANLSPYPILPTAMPTPYSCARPQQRFARFVSVIDAQAPCRRWAGIIALVAMVLLPSMRRHLCRCWDGIVALVVMALLPSPMRRRLAVVDDDDNGVTARRPRWLDFERKIN